MFGQSIYKKRLRLSAFCSVKLSGIAFTLYCACSGIALLQATDDARACLVMLVGDWHQEIYHLIQ